MSFPQWHGKEQDTSFLFAEELIMRKYYVCLWRGKTPGEIWRVVSTSISLQLKTFIILTHWKDTFLCVWCFCFVFGFWKFKNIFCLWVQKIIPWGFEQTPVASLNKPYYPVKRVSLLKFYFGDYIQGPTLKNITTPPFFFTTSFLGKIILPRFIRIYRTLYYRSFWDFGIKWKLCLLFETHRVIPIPL